MESSEKSFESPNIILTNINVNNIGVTHYYLCEVLQIPLDKNSFTLAEVVDDLDSALGNSSYWHINIYFNGGTGEAEDWNFYCHPHLVYDEDIIELPTHIGVV